MALEGLAGKLGLLPFWSEVDVPGEGWTWVEAFPWESQQAALRRHMGDDETGEVASGDVVARSVALWREGPCLVIHMHT